MTASTPLLVPFAAYLLLMIGIGFMAWRRTRTFDDYILGGRSLGSYVTALAAGASDMSGWLMMGLPGALYLGGASEAWIAIGPVSYTHLDVYKRQRPRGAPTTPGRSGPCPRCSCAIGPKGIAPKGRSYSQTEFQNG